MMTTIRRWLAVKLQWLALWLTHGALPVEVEARHGAHRARKLLMWTGDLLRIDIPVNQKPAGTSTPMGYVAHGDEQKFDHPGVDHNCPFCGHRRAIP